MEPAAETRTFVRRLARRRAALHHNVLICRWRLKRSRTHQQAKRIEAKLEKWERMMVELQHEHPWLVNLVPRRMRW